MILLLNSSTNICDISLIDDDVHVNEKWQSDRLLAKNLLKHLKNILSNNGLNWSDISGIGVFKGPGSFTGLRIGITIANSLSDSLGIPIVGSSDLDWKNKVVNRLKNQENDGIVIPNYGSEAKITTAKK